MKRYFTLAASILCASASQVDAQGIEWAAKMRVTSIEATYVPGLIVFKGDKAAGNCPAGAALRWDPYGTDAAYKAQNAQAILAVLLTAKSSNQNLQLFGLNTNCVVTYMYLE